MKSTIRVISMLLAAGLAIATLAQFTGLVTIPGASAAVLLGGLAACCLIALGLGDYTRKPAFRVRRTVDTSTDAGFTVNRPAGSPPDWTYTTRNK